MMIPSSLGGGGGNAKHHQQLIQSASMLPSPYNFFPSVFANAQLDIPLFRPPESVCFYLWRLLKHGKSALSKLSANLIQNLGAMYLSQLAAAAVQNQDQNGSNVSTASEQDETINENTKAEVAASTLSEMGTSLCGAESPLSPKPFGSLDRVESSKERNSVDHVTLRFWALKILVNLLKWKAWHFWLLMT